MKKNLMLIFAILMSVVCFYLMAVWYIFGGYAYFSKELEPRIKHGEFSIRLTYELDGKIKVIDDVLVCEFDGYEVFGEAGKYRKWRSYLKSGNEEIVLKNLRGKGIKDELGNTVIELFFSYGDAGYYMGDSQGYSPPATYDFVEYKYITEEGIEGKSAFNTNEALKKYGIRLISFEASSPVKNTFK